MSGEADFVAALRLIASEPAARDLRDDAAVLPAPSTGSIVLTHDMLVEGVHYLSADPPEDVAWKLVAVNLSDLAAKGARPIGCLMGYTLGADSRWNARFLDGLGTALRRFGAPLLGGDTVSSPGPRVLGLTAIGHADGPVPDRRGAREGDDLWVAGAIGDAGLGLGLVKQGLAQPAALVRAYRRPVPLLAAGQALAGVVTAMADVSDGLLIDAARIGEASGLGVTADVSCIPLTVDARALAGNDRRARIAAATAGDDYALVFAAPPAMRDAIVTLLEPFGINVARIGAFETGRGLALMDGDVPIDLPDRLGYEHEA